MLSPSEILDPAVWEEMGGTALVKEVANQLGLTERSIHRKLERWKESKTHSFSEDDLAKIKVIVDREMAALLRETKHRFRGMILVTDDITCEPIQKRKQKAFEERWATLGPGQSPFYFPPLLLKLDIPIVVVLRDRQLSDLLAKTEKVLFQKATHQSSLPVLKNGDYVILVTKYWKEEKLSEELFLRIE